MTAPCHTNCRSAHPTACAAGCCSHDSIAGMVLLSPALRLVNRVTDVAELLGRRALRRERLEHELHRRSAERPIHQIAYELTLRLLLAEPRAVDVRAVALVTLDEPLLDHDLQQLQRGRIRALTVAGEHVMDLTDGAGSAFPENAEDGQLGVGRARDRGSGHAGEYLRTTS